MIFILGAQAILGIWQKYYPPSFGVNCFTKIFSLKNFVLYGILVYSECSLSIIKSEVYTMVAYCASL